MQASTTKYRNDLRAMEKDYRFEKNNQEKMMREKHGLSHDIKKLIDDNKRLEAEIHALQSNFESEKIRKERNALRLERERFEREKYDFQTSDFLVLTIFHLSTLIYLPVGSGNWKLAAFIPRKKFLGEFFSHSDEIYIFLSLKQSSLLLSLDSQSLERNFFEFIHLLKAFELRNDEKKDGSIFDMLWSDVCIYLIAKNFPVFFF